MGSGLNPATANVNLNRNNQNTWAKMDDKGLGEETFGQSGRKGDLTR